MRETIDCVTDHKTAFFRGVHHLNFLSETIVSDLKAGAFVGRTQQVRIWSAACSTGEEPFSIAISLLEAFRDAPDSAPAIYRPGGWCIEVVATDVDNVALAMASEGIYPAEQLAAVSLETAQRYFYRGRGEMTGKVRVRPGLAELVKFQQVDLESGHWEVQGHFDAIFFRDGLSALRRERQEPCLRAMLRFLNPHGYLILGLSETVPWLSDAVSPIGKGIHQLRPLGKARYTGKERRTSCRKRQTPAE